MSWLFAPYLLPLLVAVVISIGLAVYGWQRRAIIGAPAFVVLMLAVAEWSLAYLLELWASDLAAKIFWVKVEYLGIVTLPAAWLVFALQYSESRRWLTYRRSIIAALLVGPLVTLALVWTNGLHHLIWRRIELDAGGPFPTLSLTYGDWFWLHSAASYLLLLAGTVVLLAMAFRLHSLYRRQAAALMLAVLIPWLGNLLYLFGPRMVPNVDLTPFAFTLSGVALAWTISRLRLFQIMPIARRAVLDGMEDGVIVLDAENCVVDLNPRAQQVIGVDADAIGRPAADVLAGQPQLLGCCSDMTPARTEISLSQGGQSRHYSLRVSPLHNARNRRTGRVLVLRDVTERKKWELTLRQDQNMFLSGPVVVFKWQNRENWPVEYVSTNVGDILGYQAEVFLQGGVLYADLVHPEDLPRVTNEVTAHSQSGAGRFDHQPYRLIHQNGKTVWVLDYTTILRDSAGHITHYLGYIVDITRRKRAERQLSRQLAFSQALNRIADAITTQDDAEGILTALARIMGETLQVDRSLIYDILFEEHLAMGLCEWLSPACPEITPSKDTYSLDLFIDGTTSIRESRSWLESHSEQRNPHLAQDGSAQLLHEQMNIQSLLWYPFAFRADGFYLLVFNQVSHRRKWAPDELAFVDAATRQAGLALQKLSLLAERDRAEKALRKSNQHLTETLAELQETQDRMVQRERLAAVGQLAAGIAHDFNNILTVILGYADMLRISPDVSERVRGDLRHIANAGRRAAQLIRQLLDFSRKTVRQAHQLDLGSFSRELVEFLRRTIPENIQIRLSIEPGEFVIEADRTQLQQLITNLVVNARDAMPGGGALQLALARVEATGEARCAFCLEPIEGERVRFQVRDTGSGIPEEVLPHIFEPFFTTKEVGKGSGLGLSQVAGIVGQHEGHITVESELGQGTTFSFYLPISREEPTMGESAEPPRLAHGRGKTILLVEDDRAVRKVGQAMLESLGYQVLSAVNGKNALAIYSEHRNEIELVISDMVMPDMDGMALFANLKTIKANMKMVVLSGYPLRQNREEMLRQGIVAWLQKPMSVLQLSQVLDKALSVSGKRGSQ